MCFAAAEEELPIRGQYINVGFEGIKEGEHIELLRPGH